MGDDDLTVRGDGSFVIVEESVLGETDSFAEIDNVTVDSEQAITGDVVTVGQIGDTGTSVITIDAGVIDAQPERLVVLGSDGDDVISVDAHALNGEPIISGLGPSIEATNFFLVPDVDAIEVRGRAGDDSITISPDVAEEATFALFGGFGDDLLVGAQGNDVLDGGDGDDTVIGRGGVDLATGGPGADTIEISGTHADDTIQVALAGTSLLVSDRFGNTEYSGFDASELDRLDILGFDGRDDIIVGTVGVPVVVDGGPSSSSNSVTLIGDSSSTRVGMEDASRHRFLSVGGIGDVNIQNVQRVTVNSAGSTQVVGSGTADEISIAGLAANAVRVEDQGNSLVDLQAVTDVTVSLLGGSDRLNLELNDLLVGDVDIIGGGEAENDRVSIRGNDSVFDDPTWTPFGADSGVVEFASSQLVFLTRINDVTYDAEGEDDRVTFTGTGGSDVVEVGQFESIDSATVGMHGFLPIEFRNLGILGAITVAAGGGLDQLLFATDDGSDQVFVQSNGVVNYSSLLGTHIPVVSDSVESLAVETRGDDDEILVAGDSPFETIRVVAGGDQGDKLGFGGAADSVALNLSNSTISQAGFANTIFDGIQELNLSANGQDLNVFVSDEDDFINFTPLGIDSGRLAANDVAPTVRFETVAAFNLDAGAGENRLIVNGSSDQETIMVTESLVTVGGRQTVNYLATGGGIALTVDGREGNDTFAVTPGADVPIYIDGGDPIGMGDVVQLSADNTAQFTPGPETDSGAFVVDGTAPVSFDHIESVSVFDPSGDDLVATVMGTNADDDFTTVGVEALVANVIVNDGPTVTYTGLADLSLQGKGGDDDFDIDLNGLVIASFSVEGGLPVTDRDTVTVTGRPGEVDDPTWTPSEVDSGAIVIGSGQSVDIEGVERLIYDGESDGDAVTSIGSALGDLQVHWPGLQRDSGSIQIERLLTLEYQNLGTSGRVVADGLAGNDMLVTLGTLLNDDLAVDFPGAGRPRVVLTSAEGAHVPVEGASIENHRLDALDGDDVIGVTGNVNVSGVLEVLGGANGDGSDILNFTAGPLGTELHLGNATISVAADPFGDLVYDGIEHLNIAGSGQDLEVAVTDDDDHVEYTPLGVSAGRLQANHDFPVVEFDDVAIFDLDTLAGQNRILVHGTSAANMVTVTPLLVTVDGRETVNYGATAGSNSLTVDGHESSDRFNVTPSADVPIFIDGGDPIGMGDVLDLTADTTSVFSPGPESDAGGFVIDGLQPVSFDQIEEVEVNDPSGTDLVATVMGTHGDDAITASGVAVGAMNVTVNRGPVVSYTGLSNLILQGKNGDDDFTVDQHITSLGVMINVDGGLPTGGSDELRVTGVDGANDLPMWLPDAVDGGTLQLDGQAPIIVDLVETLIYDGEGDGESLSVEDALTAITHFVHEPGAAIDAGFVGSRGASLELLGINYEDLGNNGAVTVSAAANGGSSMTALGTEANDLVGIEFTATDAIEIVLTSDLGTHVDLRSVNVSSYAVDSLHGDDDLNVLAPINATGTFELRGGGPGAGTDTLNLTAQSSVKNDVIIRPDAAGASDDQDIVGLGAQIDLTGVELITLVGQSIDDDSLSVELGAGDNVARIERGSGIPSGAGGSFDADQVTSDSLPQIEFTGLDDFTAIGQAGADVIAFATWFLAGATPANYKADLGATDTLVIEGVDGASSSDAASDRLTVTNPDDGDVRVTDNKGTTGGVPVVVTATSDTTGRLQINTLGGDDVVTVDVGGASDVVGVPITFDGGVGSDLLTVTGDPATAVDEVIYTPGPDITEGRLFYEDGVDTRLMSIDFVNLEPVNELLVAANLTVNGTHEENDITYHQGAAAGLGRVTVDGFEWVDFQNKVNLNLNGLNGGDTIVLDNADLPTGLQTIVTNANFGDDLIQVIDLPDASVTAFVTATLNGDDGDDHVDASNLAVDTPLLINGGRGADRLVGGRGDDAINGGGGDDVVVGGDPAITPMIGDNIYDAGPGYDTLEILGTDAADTIDVNQASAVALTSTINGNASSETFAGLEAARIDALGREDVIRLLIDDTLFAAGSNPSDDVLAYTVAGGATNTDDRLIVVDDGLGDTVIHRQSRAVDSGTISIAPSHPAGAAPPIAYEGIERIDITPVDNITARTGSDALGRLFTFKADVHEANDQLPNATFLGAGATLNLDPTIDPGVDDLGAPADEDWYEFVAVTTGTLDLQVFFESQGTLANGRSGLPGNGNLDIDVYDGAGNLMTGFGSNESVADDVDERIRIPVVKGETYYLRVLGGNGAAVNVYSLSAVNEAPPVPYDIEINDILQVGTVAAGPTTANSFAGTVAPAVSVLPPTSLDYVGKTIEFTSGLNIGRTALVTAFNSGTGQFDLGVGLVTAPATGDTFIVETTDTGRNQTDNTTRDNTPIITFRIEDDIYLFDLPGNPTSQTPPDEVIAIPFNGDQAAAVVAGPGFRVPVFVEGAPQQTTNQPQVPVGYARPVAGTNGVYTFDFATDAIGGPLTLTDGSHFVSAKVEIIDPATPTAYGFGERSDSLELLVDATTPIAYFGDPAIVDDGLHPDSDSGDGFVVNTLRDRVTNDTTPTFFGRAEANTIVRAYVDLDGSLTVTPADVLIGQTVATPIDGINQHPFGEWEITSTVGMNDAAQLGSLGVDGLRTILISAEDLSGNVTPGLVERLDIFIDTAGPNVTDVFITTAPTYNLFDLKPANVVQGPTPRTDSITIDVRDLPARATGFLYEAISNVPPLPPVVLQGDHSGVIAITDVQWDSDPVVDGGFATGSIVLTFAEPLPDDRFTLTLGDSVIDPAGNSLDGENNAAEPIGSPFFPTGDGIPGGDFVARFTIDSRPEVATWSQGIVYADINGNFVWDPEGEDNDATNRDFAYNFGELTDAYFTGNFSATGAVSASGFDKVGAYGAYNGQYQFFLDTDDDGVGDTVGTTAFPVNAIPVAGDFNAVHPGDEIGAFDGQNWYLDVNGNNNIDANERFPTVLRGLPVVGDFNGDGVDDLATYSNDTGSFQFDLDRDHAVIDDVLNFGFSGFGEKPVSGDVNLDGVDDIVLWVPGREGQLPKDAGEFHFLVSDSVPLAPNVNTLVSNVFSPFSPAPLGNDLISQFGDDFALPLIGNFDPPISQSSAQPIGSQTNSRNPLDTNADGRVSPADALSVIDQISIGKDLIIALDQPLRAVSSFGGLYLDVNGDSTVSPQDALVVINAVSEQSRSRAASAEQTRWSDAVDSFFADDDSESESVSLLDDEIRLF